MQVRIGTIAGLLLAGLVASGCGQRTVLTAKVDKVFRADQLIKLIQRLPSDEPAVFPPDDARMYLVVSVTIRNPTKRQQTFDQDKVELIGPYSNSFSRIGLTVDCGDKPSFRDFEGKLDKLQLKPGETLAADPRVTCFVFAVPSNDRNFLLRVPGAPDVPVLLPARADVTASSAPLTVGQPTPASGGAS